MKPSKFFKTLFNIVFFGVFAYYIYYFNLLPIDQWLDNIKPSLPQPVVKLIQRTQDFLPKKFDKKISPARDLSGKWVGVAPQGAIYRDYIANYACSYVADLTLNLKQNDNNISGSINFHVRKSVQRLQHVPCLPTDSSFTLPIAGTVSITDIIFSNAGISGVYSSMKFTGKLRAILCTAHLNVYPLLKIWLD